MTEFKIPESAQPMDGANVTWNGTTAWYDPADRMLARAIVRQAKRGDIDPAAAKNQLDVLHELKLAGAVLRDDYDDDVEPEPAAEPLSDPGVNLPGKQHAADKRAPDTERKAAALIYPRSGTKRLEVLAFLAEQGDRGATDEEVSLGTDMRLYTAAPRRKELVEGGWVEDSGSRRRTTTGADAAVWRLTLRGRVKWNLEGGNL